MEKAHSRSGRGDSEPPEALREARLLLAQALATMTEARLVERALGSEESLLLAGPGELADAGLAPSLARRLVAIRAAREHVIHEETLAAKGGRAIVYGERDFARRLLTIPDAPAALYVRGFPVVEGYPSVAMIGSRRCTPEGLRFALETGEDLARGNVAVVSGLARGIDSAALRGCLRGGAPAVGVLGSGLDFVYPPENGDLFDEIAAAGALVTEFPLGIRPSKHLFPRRNRLISGLSDGVLVVEASDRSGTLITVDHALQQNRVVMAVPGAVRGPYCQGTNRLIRDGAQVVITLEDVFVSLGIPAPGPARDNLRDSKLAKADARVLDLCTERAVTPDVIAWRLREPVDTILRSLARLEAQTLVTRFSGGRFLAVRDSSR